ncbi:hypothetical protein Mp_3g18350 [Marchantia polymorpha subsp. ruderalis]|uniref:Uncharacterized protein n=2 Tax=Marchantia polymorpha TaxID=3197 RepID=A0AAF6B264_MARPO|nr:hypothetical protein MARPO_0140s0007 [Marchantia polymorpha]BBN06098.1 hypothetical protein Mp_3g18350 [Marchantia polymorpha subsp. ruderalis]|eukprot:PTQ29470.1 hypothetical protein MARPO_0140s0007 [Marchantia polymorpha]
MRRAKKEQLAVRAGGRGLEPDDHARAVEYCADMSKARSSKTNLRTRSGPRRSTESKCGSESKELHSSNDDDDNVAWIPGMPWTEGRKEGRRGWGNLVAVRTSMSVHLVGGGSTRRSERWRSNAARNPTDTPPRPRITIREANLRPVEAIATPFLPPTSLSDFALPENGNPRARNR